MDWCAGVKVNMKKHLVLELDGDFEKGIRVKLEVKKDIRSLPQTVVRGKLSPNRELLDLYRQWQQRYASLEGLFRDLVHSNPNQITHGSNRQDAIAACQSTATLVEAELNRWLNTCETFAPIRNELLQVGQGFRLWVQTSNPWLQRLPWEKWDLFTKANAEIALIMSEYSLTERTSRPRNKIRILAVLGHATDLKNLATDQEIIDKIAGNAGAEIVWKQEPSPQVLNQLLREQYWDILFFSGHSASTADGKRYEIQLTANHLLEIPDFRFALREATQKGLCLAIFNSCDGIGLTHQIADENEMVLPHLVFMREKLPDAVSPKFLQAFLNAFTQNQSLYASVQEAQRILHDDWEREYPCASWLPVVCANPTEDPPTWNALSQEAKTKQWWRSLHKVMAISLAAASVVIGVRELGGLETVDLATYDHMMQLKPAEKMDEDLFIITIDDDDLKYQDDHDMPRLLVAGTKEKRSLSGKALSTLLTKLDGKPKVIALDVNRPISSKEEFSPLVNQLKQTSNLIAICSADVDRPVEPPPELPISRIGFSDAAYEGEGQVRRYLYQAKFEQDSPCLPPASLEKADARMAKCSSKGYAPSFGLVIAMHYLEDFNCDKLANGTVEVSGGTAKMQPMLKFERGPYRSEASELRSGRQLMLNYRRRPDDGVESIKKIAKSKPLRKILEPQNNSFKPEILRDKIVLIGVTRPGVDEFLTPLSDKVVPGVYIHAHAVSEIVQVMREKRSLIWFLKPWQEGVWVVGWAITGGLLAWVCVDFRIFLIANGGALVVLMGLSFVLFNGWALWLPMVPAGLAIVGAAWNIWIALERGIWRRNMPKVS
jgi:CHASE2 domain-containing sensor protein